MKRAALLALVLAACSSKQRPVISSFTVDEPNPEAGRPVTFTFSVSGATTIVLLPLPGLVSQSPVSVVPPAGTTTFTLRADNEGGVTARNLNVAVRDAVPTITDTDAIPGQSLPGAPVTISWSVSGADHATVGGGEFVQPLTVPLVGSTVVHPTATTSYTVTAFNRPGLTPESVTATIIARVFSPPSVSGFTANPGSIVQGEASTLRWSGNAASYSISDGTTTFQVGPRQSLVVRPAASTTYTLNARGPVDTLPLQNPPTTTVTVTPHAGSTLAYGAPAGGLLQLVADVCNSPCAALTFRIVANGTVQLRGAALNLPLDATKVSFNASSFGLGTKLAAAVSGAGLGSGILQDTLVLGVALKGTGTGPAADLTLNDSDEVAHFTLALTPAGGAGEVFNGATLATQPAPAFKAVVQSDTRRTPNAIAVGTLVAQ